MGERRRSPLDTERIEPHMCSIDVRLRILSQVPFFAGLKEEEIVEINQRFREHGFSAEETIYFAGDPATHLYVVADGRVKLMRHTASGKEVLLELLTPGEFFGSLSSAEADEYADTAIAQTPACVLEIEKPSFRGLLARYPSVALKVLEIISERLQAAQEQVRQLSAFSVEKRIAATLVKLGDKFGEQQEVGLLIQVPLSRDDLAQMTGTTTETASRVMSVLQKEGLIESGRQWVAIADYEGLKALASEDELI